MGDRITIRAGSVTAEAELNESPTARAIWEALPITGQANTWGDEVYFEIPVQAALAADARAEVEVGELGYWPVGSAFCIFFGPTPMSAGEKPQAASPVNVVGRMLDDATIFRQVRQGETVELVELAAASA
ncbi:MAG TPA: hypothetical protein ENN19_13120 [Chloroflexi bacterium]|nr:hypothetical protein [Chloroflexota bacterium]